MTDLLNIGASGISAYRTALGVVGNNVTNAETAGYTRREVALNESAAASATDPYSLKSGSAGGVTAGAVQRSWDDYQADNARQASSDAARASTRSTWLSASETGLDSGDTGVGAKLTTFFNAATVLSATPDDTLARQQMVNALGDATTQIQSSAGALAKVSDGIASSATSTVASINDDLAAVANVNLALNRSTAGTDAAASLADERDKLLDGLSAKIGINVSLDAKGVASVTLAGSSTISLVSGGNVSLLNVEAASDGRLALSLSDSSATAVLPTGGSLAGLVDAAGAVASTRSSLNGIASDFATKVNAWNAAGTTPAGTAGAPLLTGTTAATLALASGVDGSAIAAKSADGTANGNLAALSTLRGSDGAESRIDTLIGANAQLLASTKAEASATATRSDTAFATRDATSGVDMDKEAADLLRYQQAYDGSARVLQVAKETLTTILQLF